MKNVIFLCSMLILASGNALAQSESEDKPAGASQRQSVKKTGAVSETERARREADKAIGEAANPDRRTGPDPESGPESGRDSGTRAADHEDHGNETSQQMLQRRDESKAIKEEYKASGKKQSGKKPWHTHGRDQEADEDDAGARGKGGVGKSGSGKKGKSDRSDDQDHD